MDYALENFQSFIDKKRIVHLVVYQLGLCERELNNVIYGRKEPERKIVKTVSAGNDRDIQKQKKIEADDVCPICQEDLVKSRGSLTYCR